MKDKKIALLSILMLLPLTVLADGEEVLIPFSILIIEIVIFFIVIVAIKIKAWWKSILIVVYFLSIVGAFYFTNNMPFRDNEVKINIILTVIPLVAVIVTYMILKFVINNKTSKELKDI